jgi:TolB protein
MSMRLHHLLAIAAVAPLLAACGPSNRIGLHTTEAATSLTQVTRGAADEKRPAVARDGSAIAYESVAKLGATPHVEVVSLASGASRAVAERSMEPTWMPGGGGLVCVSPGAHETTQLVQTFGEGAASAFAAPVGHPLLGVGWPAASPDGRWVAVSLGNAHLFHTHTNASAHFDPALALIEVRGTGTVALGSGAEPTWSPDGRRLAFVRPTFGRAHLYVANAARDASALQLTDGADDDAQPAWSPDGSLIAFCSSPVSNGIARNANLFVVKPDGSGLRQLTEGDSDACRPAWGPGGVLYFHANVDGRFHIWKLVVRS